ncbi:MAG: dihydroneopterin aldolase [Candidatus Pacebacteria bacterium]|nr:dihydroneopterin aldolase [Candidatus Paceibacterota bacterium]
MSNLSKLYLNKLVFSGIHGQTGREKTDPQYFQVDIEMEIDISKACESDSLSDTYDYKYAREIARGVIEDEHYILIETIAHQIAERICKDPKVFFATVVISKLNASKNGVPRVEVAYKRAPQEMGLHE